MTHAPAAARALVASALSVTALLTTAACGSSAPNGFGPDAARSSAASASPSAAAPAAEQPSSAPPALDEAQMRSALITELDLGEPWVPTRGAATWRDGLLKAQVKDAECRRLLDALYTEELFGEPAGPRAVVTLDDAYNGSQLRYQIAAHRAADVDRALQWLRTMPERCGEFTAATARAGEQDVAVEELELPAAGDARLALRLTMTGETADGEPTYLTVDLAAVRVGEDAITLTNGGYGEVPPEVAQGVAELGAERLTEVQRQGRAQV